MGQYDQMVLDTFLEKQLQLFPEKVAETREDAEDFLDLCMAVVCRNKKELRQYFKETGTDISGISDLTELEEVFPLPDGRFLVLEA